MYQGGEPVFALCTHDFDFDFQSSLAFRPCGLPYLSHPSYFIVARSFAAAPKPPSLAPLDSRSFATSPTSLPSFLFHRCSPLRCSPGVSYLSLMYRCLPLSGLPYIFYSFYPTIARLLAVAPRISFLAHLYANPTLSFERHGCQGEDGL
jgi:hypothetical protein